MYNVYPNCFLKVKVFHSEDELNEFLKECAVDIKTEDFVYSKMNFLFLEYEVKTTHENTLIYIVKYVEKVEEKS